MPLNACGFSSCGSTLIPALNIHCFMAASPLVCVPRRSQRLAGRLASASFPNAEVQLNGFARNLVVRSLCSSGSVPEEPSSIHYQNNGAGPSQEAIVSKKTLPLATRKRNLKTVSVQFHGESEIGVQETKRTTRQSSKIDAYNLMDKGGANQENVTLEPASQKSKGRAKRKNERVLPSRDMEARLWQLGFRRVGGVDEAGRGPLAGPLVAACCIIPENVTIEGIDDSKKLREEERERLFEVLVSTPGVSYAVCVVEAGTIDQINILQATMEAMRGCIQQLCASSQGPDYVLVDGNRLPSDLPPVEAEAVIKGDAVSHVIAAASIIAKVTRDRLMNDYDKKWPEYGFKAHKGYGTVAHIAALLKCGPCHIHRKSFAPIKDWKEFSL